MRTVATIATVASVACATTQTTTERCTSIGMSVVEAAEIVSQFEAKHAADIEGSAPASTDDVLAILKSDRIDRFAAGVEYLAKLDSPEARALEAQLELAWGEAQFLVGNIMWKMADRLGARARRMRQKAASGELAPDDARKLADLNDSALDFRRTAEALTTVAAEHTARGAKVAMQIIESNPDSYLGYRVAADYYRLREDWAQFDEMVAKIEETNPKSNGLLFLKGVAAIQREDDPEAGATFLRNALANDPEFTRARAHLLLSRSSLADTYAEYSKLKEDHPAHQIVVWAGPAIEDAHDEWEKERRERLADQQRRATAPAPSAVSQ